MKELNGISDEELAAYMENVLSDRETERIDRTMDVDTMEVLGVSRRAMNEFGNGNEVELPDWGSVCAETADIRPLYAPLAMAGFLGDENGPEEGADEPEDGNKPEQ